MGAGPRAVSAAGGADAARESAQVSEALRHRDPARARRYQSVRLYLLWDRVPLERGTVMITIDLVLLILALVCFLAAAANVASPRVNLVAAGLALWVASIVL